MPGDYAVPGGGAQRLDPSSRAATGAPPQRAQQVAIDTGDAQLLLAEQEVPRNGAVVTRTMQVTRWIDSSYLLWCAGAQRPGTGRGGERVPVRRDLPAGLSELQPRTLGRGGPERCR